MFAKYLKIIKRFISLNFQKDVIYRFNFLFTFITTTVYLLVFIYSVKFIFNQVDMIGKYNYDQMFILIILTQLWWYLNVIFIRKNFQLVYEGINKGKLDMYLLKPINFRLLNPFLEFDFRHVPPAIVAFTILIPKLYILELSLTQVLLACVFFINGLWITYSFTSIFISANFWVGRNNSVFDITLEFAELLKIPNEFYPMFLSGIFTFLIPIFVIVYPSFNILMGEYNSELLISAILVGCMFSIFSKIVWKKGIEKYSSAN